MLKEKHSRKKITVLVSLEVYAWQKKALGSYISFLVEEFLRRAKELGLEVSYEKPREEIRKELLQWIDGLFSGSFLKSPSFSETGQAQKSSIEPVESPKAPTSSKPDPETYYEKFW